MPRNAQSRSTSWLYANSLTLVLLALFAVSLVGHAITGWLQNNEQLTQHNWEPQSLLGYISSGDFISTVFENWESEFLQMLAYVMLTIWLRQRGSIESKSLQEKDPVDKDPEATAKPDSPWPVRAGGWALGIYRNSLSLALGMLFIASFALHAFGSTAKAVDEARMHGLEGPTFMEHMAGAEFWFESFQNWQSEFLSIAVFIMLGIWLRQHGSPESKPTAEPHYKTGH